MAEFVSAFLVCRLFGHSGACGACGQSIPASEMVMRAQGNVYHLKVRVTHVIIGLILIMTWYHITTNDTIEFTIKSFFFQCFTCATCRNRLVPGDRFHYINGTIFCEHDRPGGGLHSGHPTPLQANTMMSDQKVRDHCSSHLQHKMEEVNGGNKGSEPLYKRWRNNADVSGCQHVFVYFLVYNHLSILYRCAEEEDRKETSVCLVLHLPPLSSILLNVNSAIGDLPPFWWGDYLTPQSWYIMVLVSTV